MVCSRWARVDLGTPRNIRCKAACRDHHRFVAARDIHYYHHPGRLLLLQQEMVQLLIMKKHMHVILCRIYNDLTIFGYMRI